METALRVCDAALLLELASWRHDRESLIARAEPASALEALDERRSDVIVRYVGDERALRECMHVGHYNKVIATGTIRLADIDKLITLDGVSRISLAARVHPQIDRSMGEIKVEFIRSQDPPYVAAVGPQPYTGKGVLFGIIDDIIDPFHHSFMVPNSDPNITRIVGLWSQVPNPRVEGEKRPPGFTYGTFFDFDQINRVLKERALGAFDMRSQWDHGSHVAGIAAGNGAIQDNLFKPYTFVGVAPEADIAFCDAGRGSATTRMQKDALRFIFDLATGRAQPCVVNMSIGTHEGARDGSSDVEQEIERLLHDADGEPVPGRAVVVSVGNEAKKRRHSRKIMNSNGTLPFRIEISEIVFKGGTKKLSEDVQDDKLHVWYDGAASIRVRLTPPGKSADPDGWVKPGDVPYVAKTGAAKIFGVSASAGPDPRNGKNNVVIELFAPVKFGFWTLEMQEISGNEATVDIWIDRLGDEDIWPRFPEYDNVKDNTVTCPATAKGAIAVGAYISEPDGPLSGEHYGDICSFSSWGLGPAAEVDEEETRPHIVAPGNNIISANSSASTLEQKYFKLRFDDWTLSQHAVYSGTSQAAPHVSGVIALMFQRNPFLTCRDIIQIFKDNASKAQIPPGATFPNAIWGYGKLDARAMLAAVPLFEP